MKLSIGLALCVLLSVSKTVYSQAISSSELEPKQIRVLCYNIHHGRGNDQQVDLERIASVIRKSKADVIALQEVDNQTERTGRVDQTAALARLTGLNGKFLKQIDYEGGGYGQAILSKWTLGDAAIHWLPGSPERERRIAGSIKVESPDHSFTFISTHLHHANSAFREHQAQEINRIFQNTVGPAILCGDMNAEPDHETIRYLRNDWILAQSTTTLLTFLADKPTRQLDYVFFRPKSSYRLVESHVLDEPMASDHRPLVVTLELNSGK
jgi:endonuclease/exonuclease/phosphatase family metal-dependent hydrolase